MRLVNTRSRAGRELGSAATMTTSTPSSQRRPPVMADVARLAGVSLGTVSNVVNAPDRVRPATRQKVEEAIASLGFVPNTSARTLAAGRGTLVGFVAVDLGNSYFLDIARGVEREADLGQPVGAARQLRRRPRQADRLPRPLRAGPGGGHRARPLRRPDGRGASAAAPRAARRLRQLARRRRRELRRRRRRGARRTPRRAAPPRPGAPRAGLRRRAARPDRRAAPLRGRLGGRSRGRRAAPAGDDLRADRARRPRRRRRPPRAGAPRAAPTGRRRLRRPGLGHRPVAAARRCQTSLATCRSPATTTTTSPRARRCR